MQLSDFTVKNSQQKPVSLDQYKGKVVLVVNTASKCGFTNQYEGLEELYKTYKDQGLEILAFPCNQFLHQEPGTDKEIAEFCQLNFGVSFPVHAKVNVNGTKADPLFKWLRKETPKNPLISSAVKWNFTKFLIDKEGNPVKRYPPQKDPSKIAKDIEKLL